MIVDTLIGCLLVLFDVISCQNQPGATDSECLKAIKMVITEHLLDTDTIAFYSLGEATPVHYMDEA